MPYYVDLDKKINVMLRTELYGDIGVCEMSIRQYLDNAGAELPAEDVRPVVRGRWLPDNLPGGGFWVCSNCKFPSEVFAADRLYKYCPNCGADMREVEP